MTHHKHDSRESEDNFGDNPRQVKEEVTKLDYNKPSTYRFGGSSIVEAIIHVIHPGTKITVNGYPGVINSVVLDAAGRQLYEVAWWDDERRTADLFAHEFEVVPPGSIKKIGFCTPQDKDMNTVFTASRGVL